MNPRRILHPDDWAAAAAEPDFALPLPGGKLTMLFRPIPAGAFVIGSRGKGEREEPRHIVTIAEPFLLGKFVVTQEEYAAVVDALQQQRDSWPSPKGKRQRHPVVNVSYDDAAAWCLALNKWLAKTYPHLGIAAVRLPSEAEWEYACRAGSRTEYWNGDGDDALRQVGWFDDNSGGTIHPIDEAVVPSAPERHPAGLVGMHGNVWEWCGDAWSADHRTRWCGDAADARKNDRYRVFRGGSWISSAWVCRSACRDRLGPDDRYDARGFRVCLVRGPGSPSSGGPAAAPGREAEAEQAQQDKAGETRPQSSAAGEAGAPPRWMPPLPNIAAWAGEGQPHPSVIDWRDAVAPGFGNWEVAAPAAVEAIIVGTTPEGPAAGRRGGMADFEVSLPADLGTRFPNLTHLFLWGIKGLAELPPLPEGLLFLDLRGCSDLERLPNLPPRLQSLDLGGCERLRELPPLPPALDWLALDDCTSLRSFEPVEAFLRSAFDAEGAPTETPGRVAPFDTLILHGCRFDDLDDGLCGEEPNQNVRIRVRDHFEGIAAEGKGLLPECKIIVLGDGRVGKTCLVRALKGLPFIDTPSTENIRLWSWDGVSQPFPEDPQLCKLNVWDFAGQDYYHHTHRLFLESRAVFVIVWRAWSDSARQRRDARTRADGKPELGNADHDLSYWLDQAFDGMRRFARGRSGGDDIPPVIVVRTATDETDPAALEPIAAWCERVQRRYPGVECHDVSVKPLSMKEPETRRKESVDRLRHGIFAAVKRELRAAKASQVAAGWPAVREQLATWQPVWPDDDRSPRPSEKPFCSFAEFQRIAGDVYARARLSPPSAKRIHSLLDHFHRIGAIYAPPSWRDAGAGRDLPIIIDQAWAIRAIYATVSNDDVKSLLTYRHGRLTLDDIGTEVFGRLCDEQGALLYPPEVQRALRAFMLKSGIIVPLADRFEEVEEFVFPQFLPPRSFERGQFAGAPYHLRVNGLGQEFGGLLVGWLVRVFSLRTPFRFGGIVEVKTNRATDGEGVPVRLCVEWRPSKSSPNGAVIASIEGGDEPHPGILAWLADSLAIIPGFPRDASFLPGEGGEAGTVNPAPVIPVVNERRREPTLVTPRLQLVTVGISFAGEDAANPGIEAVPNDIRARLMAAPERPFAEVLDYKACDDPPTISGLISGLAACDLLIVCVGKKYLESRYCMSEFLAMALHWDPDGDPFAQGKDHSWFYRTIIVPVEGSEIYGVAASDEVKQETRQEWIDFWGNQLHAVVGDKKLPHKQVEALAKLQDECLGNSWLRWVYDNSDCFSKVLDRIRDYRSDGTLESVVSLAMIRLSDRAKGIERSPEQQRERLLTRLKTKAQKGQLQDAAEDFERWLAVHQDPQAAERTIMSEPFADKVLESVRQAWLRRDGGQ